MRYANPLNKSTLNKVGNNNTYRAFMEVYKHRVYDTDRRLTYINLRKMYLL